MPIETKEREIGGLKFVTSQLPYMKAQRLFFRLLKIAGPAVTGLATLAGQQGGKAALVALGGMNVEQLAPALGTLFDGIDPDAMEALTREILATTRVEQPHTNGSLVMVPLFDPNGRTCIDAVIGGDFVTGIAVQAFALSVHFGNFSGARGVLADLGLAFPSKASNTSTDGKGEHSSASDGAASVS